MCLHEYAHLAAARHFGACGFVHVLRLPGGAGGARYAGRFQLHGAIDDDAWRIVALAGVVAECIDAHQGDEDEAFHRQVDAQLAGVDAELARGYGPGDVDRCRAILQEAWPALVGDAEGHQREILASWP